MTGRTSAIIRFASARLRRYASERRLLKGEARSEARLPFIITPVDSERASLKKLPDAPALVGYTRELSRRGLTLLLPSVRLGNVYLTAGESYLGVKLQLPDGPVVMLTVSDWFEQLAEKEVECSYLLDVRIVKMQKADRERYLAYLSAIKHKSKRKHERREAHDASTRNSSNGAGQSGKGDGLTTASVSQAFEQFLRDKS
jgi:hypothetical protein